MMRRLDGVPVAELSVEETISSWSEDTSSPSSPEPAAQAPTRYETPIRERSRRKAMPVGLQRSYHVRHVRLVKLLPGTSTSLSHARVDHFVRTTVRNDRRPQAFSRDGGTMLFRVRSSMRRYIFAWEFSGS